MISINNCTSKLSKTTGVILVLLATIGTSAADEPNVGMFSPLPAQAVRVADPFTPDQVALGKKLYFDKRLSLAEDISCNSCHNLETFGVDNQATSPGHLGQRGDRNSPTVFNAALHFAQFWDGRAKDVEEQALGPVLNPIEMAMPSETIILERLNKDSEYKEMFSKAFPGEKPALTFKNVGRAIGAFERTLVSRGRFDKYLEGDKGALTAEEKQGLKLFVDNGCVACHSGALLGGMMYQKLGLVKPYETKDLGRYTVTKNEADKYFFKVPSLRLISKTAPYFHDGSVETLSEAVRLMAHHQLGRDLSKEQIAAIVKFLEVL